MTDSGVVSCGVTAPSPHRRCEHTAGRSPA